MSHAAQKSPPWLRTTYAQSHHVVFSAFGRAIYWRKAFAVNTEFLTYWLFKYLSYFLKNIKGKWVHSICVLYTCELTLDSDTMRAANLGNLSGERNSLICSICNRSGGACVQCSVTQCLESFHPYCCYNARYQMVIRSNKSNNNNLYEIYCRKHRNSVRHPHTVTSSRNSLRQQITTTFNRSSKNAPAISTVAVDNLSKLNDRSQKRYYFWLKSFSQDYCNAFFRCLRKPTAKKSSKASKFFELEAAEVVRYYSNYVVLTILWNFFHQ